MTMESRALSAFSFDAIILFPLHTQFFYPSSYLKKTSFSRTCCVARTFFISWRAKIIFFSKKGRENEKSQSILACLSRKTNFYQCYRLIKIEYVWMRWKIKMKWRKIERRGHWTKTNDCTVEDIEWYIGGNNFFPIFLIPFSNLYAASTCLCEENLV